MFNPEVALDQIATELNRTPPGEITFELLLGLVKKLDQDSRIQEVERIGRWAEKLGIRCLSTDTSGVMSAEELHKMPFATGITSRCLVCALVDSEIGMAAVHRNPNTPEVVAKVIYTAFSQGVDAIRGGTFLAKAYTVEEFELFVRNTVVDAFSLFEQLAQGRIPNGLNLCLVGCDNANSEYGTSVGKVAGEVFCRFPSWLTDHTIRVDYRVGEEGGAVYNGRELRPYNKIDSQGIYFIRDE